MLTPTQTVIDLLNRDQLSRSDRQSLRTALAAHAPAADPLRGRTGRRVPIARFTPAHLRIFYALAMADRTDTQLFRAYQIRVARPVRPWPFISEAGLRTRRAELVRWGFVEHTGDYGRTKANRPTKVWWAKQDVLLTTPPATHPDCRAAIAELNADAGEDLVSIQLLQDLARVLGLSA